MDRAAKGARNVFTAALKTLMYKINYMIYLNIVAWLSSQRRTGNVRHRPHNSAAQLQQCTSLRHLECHWRLNMIGLIARWGHNVLLATLGLLTIAVFVLAR